MNQCTLCNPDNIRRRDEAYRLLASGCSIASVAEKLGVGYFVVQRCWSEHDQDPVRNITRRLVKAKKRLARAEAHHKRLKSPDVQSRLELDSALKSVNDLEMLAAQQAPKEDKTASGQTVLTLEGLDRILSTGLPPSRDRKASEKLKEAIDNRLLGERQEELCLAMLHFLQQNGIEIRIAKSWDEFYVWGAKIQLAEKLPARAYDIGQ
jgi:hypothetical protein